MSTYFLHKMNQYRSDGRKSMMFVPFLTDFVISLFDFNSLPPHSPCEVCQRLRHRWCSWNRVDVPLGCLARPRTSKNGSCSQFFRWSRLLLGNRSSRCPQCERSPLYRNAGRGRGLVEIPIRLRLINYSLERCLFPDNRWNIEVIWRRSHPAHLRGQGWGVSEHFVNQCNINWVRSYPVPRHFRHSGGSWSWRACTCWAVRPAWRGRRATRETPLPQTRCSSSPCLSRGG